jgi:hypothetical protein
MPLFEFTIVASGLDPDADDFESRFFDAGCDDATVSFQKGRILLDFGREAVSLEEAIASAVECVRAAGAVVERIEPDPLVSLSDMASRADMTRAAMTNYFKGYRGQGFPAPKARVTTDSPLWDWADISHWLHLHGRLTFQAAVNAAVVSVANEVLDAGALEFRSGLKRGIEGRLAGL